VADKQTTTPPSSLRCDVPGCCDEIAIKIGDEQRCYSHALEKGNQIRAARGLPPVTIDNEGRMHVTQ
jgi:uncharacterized protein YkwD